MNAEEFIVSNFRSRFNPLLDKHNRNIPQYTFDDVVEMAEAYHQHKLSNDKQKDSEAFSSKDMKDFAEYLSGKKVGDLDLILFKNDR